MLGRVAAVNEGKRNKKQSEGKDKEKCDIRNEEEWKGRRKRMACSLECVRCPHVPVVLTALFAVWMTCSHPCPFLSHVTSFFLSNLT